MIENMQMVLFLMALVFSSLVSKGRTAKLNAVSLTPYTEQLYQRLRNGHRPTERDPATKCALVRKRICQDITESGFFNQYTMESLDMSSSAVKLIQKKYPSIYKEIYAPRKNPIKRLFRPYKYKNKYAPRLLEAKSHIDRHQHSTTINVKEWVFVCLLKNWFDDEVILPLYVSKEYNVFGNNSSYVAGRFVFWDYKDLILAEEPARAFVSPDYNIEIHYLHQRKLYQPAQHDLADPVCRLARGNIQNQHHRLCTTVLKSAYFNGRILQVVPANHDYPCLQSKISLQTTQAVEETASGVTYHERLMPCLVVEKTDDTLEGVRRTLFYLSRAYTSYQVFVYIRTFTSDPILEVLITNVSVVHEIADQPDDPAQRVT